jgi:2-(1,2-epoxy-1,2-dihydrophenyl)acetyl-CoA isomerase
VGAPIALAEGGDGVREIVLNRPDHLNAMNVALLTALREALAEAAADEDTRAVLIRGEGRSFCVGEDLKESLAPRAGGGEELRTSLRALEDLTRIMVGAETPFVAVVHGWAVGGGAELAIAADFLVGGPSARFRFPEVRLGHAPTGGVTQRLAAAIGVMRAKEWLLTGRDIDVDEAYRAGLVTLVADEPVEAGRALAQDLATLPRRSLGATKRLVELAAAPHLEIVLRAETDAASWCFASSEAEEAFRRFRDRPRP